MTITIIGWYGTETIGDRAILAGLISIFSKSFEKFNIQLGSLNPFFTERTLKEDMSFYKEITGKEFEISLFNSKNSKELSNKIRKSNLVVMGGGPLMDLNELYMVEYAFKRARKLGIKTAILGCGVGPLFNKKYEKVVINIFKNSDISILRDTTSKTNLKEIFFRHKFINNNEIITSIDPAVESAIEYSKNNKKNNSSYIAINLRKFPNEYSKKYIAQRINNQLEFFIKDLSKKFREREIILIPMHYFHIGNDDRFFLNNIALKTNLPNISLQNIPISLKETLEVYQNAYFNVGVRFHSILFQTIVSGKNFVLDYSEPNKGKICGFIRDIDENNFYKERMVSLQKDELSISLIRNENLRFSYNKNKIDALLNIYTSKLKNINL